ncbi:MAG: hypothetical protein ACRC62_05055 [Microcoleus sp.]
MSNLVQRLSIAAHPQLEKSLGYRGDKRWVAWRWESEIDQLICSDGKIVGTGNNMPWLVFLQHDLIHPAVQKYNLNESDRHWLLLDRETRNLYVGEGKAVQNLLEQPESLVLLACLDGSSKGDRTLGENLHQKLSKVTGSNAFRCLTGLIPIGIAATLIGAFGVGTGLWIGPAVQQKLADRKTANISPISPVASCGIGGSDDFSAYIGTSNGDKELHLIGVYEASSEHGNGKQTIGAVEVKVERQNKPIILALSSYEPIDWKVNVAPGAVIEKIVVNGYNKQTISGVSGIPIETRTYEGNGESFGSFIYKWGSTTESTNTPSFVTKLEQINHTNLTSFQGCYRGTSFTIK